MKDLPGLYIVVALLTSGFAAPSWWEEKVNGLFQSGFGRFVGWSRLGHLGRRAIRIAAMSFLCLLIGLNVGVKSVAGVVLYSSLIFWSSVLVFLALRESTPSDSSERSTGRGLRVMSGVLWVFGLAFFVVVALRGTS